MAEDPTLYYHGGVMYVYVSLAVSYGDDSKVMGDKCRDFNEIRVVIVSSTLHKYCCDGFLLSS